MKCRILSEIDGRMRVRLFMPRMSLKQADIVEEYLGAVAGVKSVKVFDRNCDVVVEYSDRAAVVSALSGFSFETCGITEPKPSGRELNREYQDKLAGVVMRRVLKKALLPAPWRAAICVAKCSQYFARGVKSLWHKRLDVAVLDATAITVSVLRGDTDTASSIMFMLKIGDILEEWTHKKSVDDLARTMSLNVDKVWVKLGDTEELKNISDVNVGDDIIVRMGSMIPLDGKLVSGSAAVNQSSMTGESMPVRKEVGSYVYGGTVVEEGECVIRVEKSLGSGRYDRIVHMSYIITEPYSKYYQQSCYNTDNNGSCCIYNITRCCNCYQTCKRSIQTHRNVWFSILDPCKDHTYNRCYCRCNRCCHKN